MEEPTCSKRTRPTTNLIGSTKVGERPFGGTIIASGWLDTLKSWEVQQLASKVHPTMILLPTKSPMVGNTPTTVDGMIPMVFTLKIGPSNKVSFFIYFVRYHFIEYMQNQFISISIQSNVR